MPTDIEQLLRDAAGPLPTHAPAAQILRRASARRTRRRVSRVAMSVIVLAGLSVLTVNQLARPRVELAPGDQPGRYNQGWCLTGRGDGATSGDTCTTVVDRVNDVRFLVPEGWQSSSGANRHGVRELQAFTTAAPTDLPAPPTECLVPFLEQMGEEGAAVAVLSGSDAPGLEFGRRPKTPRLDGGDPVPPFGEPCGAPPESTVAWFAFRDKGRNFHAVMAVGPEASADRRRAAERVLNSFTVLRPAGSR